jgi:hypothetical protein
MGILVIESPILPIPPSPGDEARQIVREGLADSLEQLGEEVGKAGKPTHVLSTKNALLVSREVMTSLRNEIVRTNPLIHRVKS